jgi:hypothetical protein
LGVGEEERAGLVEEELGLSKGASEAFLRSKTVGRERMSTVMMAVCLENGNE